MGDDIITLDPKKSEEHRELEAVDTIATLLPLPCVRERESIGKILFGVLTFSLPLFGLQGTGADVVGLDWIVDMADGRSRLGAMFAEKC
ncbi:hypothetical protein Bca52824_016253 [Brassica carinata]|uniref:Uncharacterized protein n=1 Tax=Brassica carinata TaxID=52824 RepID=A0A8X7W614_BRACI|nr:hypothetical protein Bca52824_016253 [Brassica carinata]